MTTKEEALRRAKQKVDQQSTGQSKGQPDNEAITLGLPHAQAEALARHEQTMLAVSAEDTKAALAKRKELISAVVTAQAPLFDGTVDSALYLAEIHKRGYNLPKNQYGGDVTPQEFFQVITEQIESIENAGKVANSLPSPNPKMVTHSLPSGTTS